MKTIVVFFSIIMLSVASSSGNDLQGKWICSSAIVSGKTLTPETTAILRLTLTDKIYKTTKGDQVLFDSSYTLDAKKEPKQINIVGTEGDLAGKEAQGIYSLEGKKLVICYRMPGLGRPDRFVSPEGSQNFLIVWKKEE